MKLLVCTQEYPPQYSSGIGNVVYNVVKRLRKSGVACTICSPTGPDITLGSSRMIKMFGILGLVYYWYQVVRYFKERANDYDMVWLNNPFFIRNSPFKKILITIHGTYHGMSVWRIYSMHFHLLYKISSQFEKHSWSKINLSNAKFTAVSHQVLTELEEIGIDHKKITYIPNGVNTEGFKPADDKKRLRKKFNLPENDIVILSLGRLTEQKEPYRLIKVFSLVKKGCRDVTLVIAGEGELLPGAKKLTQQIGLADARFLGYVDHKKDAPGLYACSDYFAIASKYEGGEPTLTLAEAMASGLPCIASDIPHFKIIEDANCGIIVDYKDVKKAAGKIIEYLKADNSIHSKNARRYAVDNIDWQIIAQRYLVEFERLCT